MPAALVAGLGALVAGCGARSAPPAPVPFGSSSTPPAPGSAAGAADPACRAPGGDPAAAAIQTVGRRIYAQEVSSRAVSDAAARVGSDRALRAAVARGDATAAKAAIAAIEQGTHISRLQVSGRAGVLAEAGVPDVLAPVRGALHEGSGRTIGAFALSVQDEIGYVRLAGRVTGSEVLVRAGARQLRGSLTPGPTRLAQGPLTYAGHAYTAVSVPAQAFPSGPLALWLLVPRPAHPRTDCGQAYADTIAAVAGRVYQQDQAGTGARVAARRVQSAPGLADAVARRDAAAARALLGSLLRPPVARIEVAQGTRVLADVGVGETLAPAAGPLRNAAGQVVGSFAVAVQSAHAYRAGVARVTGTGVLTRVGGRVYGGTPRGAAGLPARGDVSYRGRRFFASSFDASAFPAGRLRVTVLVPASDIPGA